MNEEALKLALNALEAMQMYAAAEHKGLLIICDEAIASIKAALAQPAQAPEIHSRWQETIAGIPVIFESESEANRFIEYHLANAGKPMEQPAQLVQQDQDSCYCGSEVSLQMVSGGATEEGYLGRVTLLIDGKYVDYVKAQRTWVGLTDDEIQLCLNGLPTQSIEVYARRIEAKLKEKNT